MNIFILEDDQKRIEFFRDYLKDHDLVISAEVSQAISLVEELGPFDVYFIDHDLGGDLDGYHFAKHLNKNKVEAQFIVHSMNPVGAQNIVSILPGAIHVPFTILREDFLKIST